MPIENTKTLYIRKEKDMGYSGGYGNPSDGGYNKPDYSYGGSYNKNTGYRNLELW